jgi:hypothetical protein
MINVPISMRRSTDRNGKASFAMANEAGMETASVINDDRAM